MFTTVTQLAKWCVEYMRHSYVGVVHNESVNISIRSAFHLEDIYMAGSKCREVIVYSLKATY